jgi:mono/diheme cytochrome c family protein
MTELNKAKVLHFTRTFGICAVLALSFAFVGRTPADDSKPWVAPADAKKVKNPVPVTPENLAAGESTFKSNCALCHGEKGAGDGPMAGTLPLKPANFTDAQMMSMESDGSLFWKMSEGRGLMAPWKSVLSDKQRWQVVNYLRKLTLNAKAKH